MGIILALGALLGWGFGDFFIQKGIKKIGVWKSIFFLAVTATIILFPFVVGDFEKIFSSLKNVFILGGVGIVFLLVSNFDFEALKRGKIAIIEPILSIELPIAIGLSLIFLGESLDIIQILPAFVVFIGITLTITIHHTHLHYHKRIFERGVLLALLGAICTGTANFLVGAASRETSPMLTIWVISFISTVFSFMYFLIRGEIKSIVSDLKNYAGIVAIQSILNNLAWIFFAFAATFISVSIASAISGSYIVITVLLGIFLNHEKVKSHQIIGIVMATGGVIALSLVTGK